MMGKKLAYEGEKQYSEKKKKNQTEKEYKREMQLFGLFISKTIASRLLMSEVIEVLEETMICIY